MEAEPTHDQIVERVAQWFKENAFFVPRKKCRIAITSGKTAAWYKVHAEMYKEKGDKKTAKFLESRLIVEPDIIAWRSSKRKSKYDLDSGLLVGVEVSNSSDLKKDAKKLRNLGLDRNLVVVPPDEEEGLAAQGDIPFVSCNNLDETLLDWISDGKTASLLRAIRKRK